eukprot:s4055_g2.t1
MIMDLQVGVAIRDIIHLFYLRYVGGKPDSVEQFFLQKGNRRPDVDGDYPFYGVDEDGNYAEPPDEATLIDWAEKNWTRHPKEFVWRAYRGGLFFKKLIQYCLACGLKREDLQAEFGAVQTDKAVLAGTDERAKLQARSKALQDLEKQSEYVRKLYRGAFDCKAYSYFRPETQGMQDTLFFPPDEIVLAVRENSRKISAIYMTDFHNYELPPKVLHAYYQEMEKVKLCGNYFPLWGVLLRSHYWLRLWKQALLPMALLSIFLGALQATLVSQATPTACRTVFALLAARVISAGHCQGEKLRESQRLQELQGLSPSWNPMVVRQLLGAPGLLGLLTVFVSFVADLLSSSQPWPLLSRPVHARPGGYLVVLGALPALLSMAAALWLVSHAVNCSIFESEEICVTKELGCFSGYLSILLGLLTLLLHLLEDLPKVQVMSLVFCLGTMVIAVVASAFGNCVVGGFNSSRCLVVSTLCSAFILSSFIVMLLLDQQVIPNHYELPQQGLAIMEYLSVAAYLLWPLAWTREVHSSWQLHKAWPSKPIQMA